MKVYLSPSNQVHNVGVDGITEADRMRALAARVKDLLEMAGATVLMSKPGMTPAEVAADSNAQSPDLHICLHSNAGEPGASGTETWCYVRTNSTSTALGRNLQARVVQALGLPDRGVRDVDTPGHHWTEVVQTHAPAALIEIFFHDNLADITAFTARRDWVAVAITLAILETLQSPEAWRWQGVFDLWRAGFIDSFHDPRALVTWGELGTVLSRQHRS